MFAGRVLQHVEIGTENVNGMIQKELGQGLKATWTKVELQEGRVSEPLWRRTIGRIGAWRDDDFLSSNIRASDGGDRSRGQHVILPVVMQQLNCSTSVLVVFVADCESTFRREEHSMASRRIVPRVVVSLLGSVGHCESRGHGNRPFLSKSEMTIWGLDGWEPHVATSKSKDNLLLCRESKQVIDGDCSYSVQVVIGKGIVTVESRVNDDGVRGRRLDVLADVHGLEKECVISKSRKTRKALIGANLVGKFE